MWASTSPRSPRPRTATSGWGCTPAARIGAAAVADEVLVSCSSLDGLEHGYTLMEPRQLTLKGIAEPVPVASIEWD